MDNKDGDLPPDVHSEDAPSAYVLFMRSLAQSGNDRVVWTGDELRRLHDAITQAVSEDSRTRARHALACTAIRFMLFIANRYRSRVTHGIEFIDLVSAGYEGLYRATEDYNPKKGTFVTYAFAWVKRSLQRAIEEMGRNSQMSEHHTRCVHLMVKATEELRQQLMREPTLGEIAGVLQVDIERVELLRLFAAGDQSLYISIHDNVDDRDTEGRDIHDHVIEDDSPDQIIEKADMLLVLWLQITRLPLRERHVVLWRYGLAGFEAATFDEIAEYFGCSPQYIYQIERSALAKLRFRMKDMREIFF